MSAAVQIAAAGPRATEAPDFAPPDETDPLVWGDREPTDAPVLVLEETA